MFEFGDKVKAKKSYIEYEGVICGIHDNEYLVPNGNNRIWLKEHELELISKHSIVEDSLREEIAVLESQLRFLQSK